MIYLTAFILSFLIAVIFTPISVFLARNFNVLDYPKNRNVHKHPLPRWGGIGIFAGVFLTIAFLFILFPSLQSLLAYKSGALHKELTGIIYGGIIVFILGLIDDKKSVQPSIKFLIQIIAAYVVLDYGVRISGLNMPFFNYYKFPLIFSQIVTIFWIIGFMNTINLADGLDGLAAGIAVIASGTFFVVALLQGQTKIVFLSKQLYLASILSVILTGSCLGFLLYNFNPAKVFMGDSGALFIGFMLSAISIIGTLKSTAMISILIPITVVALPIIDVGLSIYRRFRNGKGLMQADKGHLHHRLMQNGWTQKEVVLLMYVFTLLLSICSILLTVFNGKA